MINLGNKLVFNMEGEALDQAVRKCFIESSDAMRASRGWQSVSSNSVSTKTYYQIYYSKIVEEYILGSKAVFGQGYLNYVFECYTDTSPSRGYDELLPTDISVKPSFKKSGWGNIRKGLGFFLLALHAARAITLPATFNFPSSRNSSVIGFDPGDYICEKSELMAFIRSVPTKAEHSCDPAFTILPNPKAKEYFSTYGFKLLLATGWHTPEDANYEELLTLFRALQESGSAVSVYSRFAKILKAKFGARIPGDFGSPGVWDEIRRPYMQQNKFDESQRETWSEVFTEDLETQISSEEVFHELLEKDPLAGSPVHLAKALKSNPSAHPLQKYIAYWVELQNVYFERTRRENYNGTYAALGYFNLYLSYYLVAWFRENPDVELVYPTTPELLIGPVYISRFIEPDKSVPRTFMEFMNARFMKGNWVPNAYYAVIKQVEIFFDFVIENASKLPHCTGFAQPLSRNDYQRTTSLGQTTKTPISRDLFPKFIAYVEAVKCYVDSVLNKVLSGKIGSDYVEKVAMAKRKVIWCNRYENVLPMPEMLVDNNKLKLACIPNVLRVGWRATVDGAFRCLPHPHAINQILVALYSGRRHNHIQWLDAEDFDNAAEENVSFTYLLMNTDKVNKTISKVYVNKRVIEILRDQRNWRGNIDEPRFKEKQYYNNNPKTAYKKFFPLFAAGESGLPHSDAAYADVFAELLLGFQGILPEIMAGAGKKIPVLCKLRPVGVAFNDIDEKEKLSVYSDTPDGHVKLVITTDITPHSTRVGVVSHLTGYIPNEMIGEITGQTPALVSYYTVHDEEDRQEQLWFQAFDLKKRRSQGQSHTDEQKGCADRDRMIKADELNSSLAKSMRVNVSETIVRYGCVALVSEAGTSGLDSLIERGIDRAAFNKTEICPFDNNCPPDLIKQLLGWRRCSLCPYAVRSIDHLPAIGARKRNETEKLILLDSKLRESVKRGSFTDQELRALEEDRLRLAADIAGWELCEEVLEQTRSRVVRGEDSRRWVVEQPEILRQRLERVTINNTELDYLLLRLAECRAYPGFQNTLISGRFERFRRNILVKVGQLKGSVPDLHLPNAASEFAGQIKSLVEVNKISLDDIRNIFALDDHLNDIPVRIDFKIIDA